MTIDLIQIILAFVIVVLTSLLFIIGLQFFQILKEFKKSLEKVNKILDDTGRITESIAEPIEQASDFIIGLKNGIAFFKTISRFFGKKSNSAVSPDKSDKPKFSKKEKENKPKKKHFFTKKGKSLGKTS